MQTEEERFAELEALADSYAEAQAQADYLAEFKKSKLAILQKDAEVAGATSVALQEREARRNAEYTELLLGIRTATEVATKKKWRLEIAKMRFEWARTKAANRRAEMNLR